MKAPKEIYLALHKAIDKKVGWHINSEWYDKPISYPVLGLKMEKYIRADLAELTWEDIRAICDCFMDAGLHSELPARSKELYKEVLRRFLESKKEVEL